MKNNRFICALLGAFLFWYISFTSFAAESERVIVPDGYINSDSKITIEAASNRKLESIRVKLDHGAYQDITDTKSFSVDKNCTAYVKVRYEDETVELEKEIKNYDGNPPKVSAYIKGEDLTISVSDEISGVKYLDVDGIKYTEFTDNCIAINLKDLENNAEYFTIMAYDNAGNRTNTLRVYNPYYVGEDPQSNTDKGVNNPQSADETKPTSATGVITSHTDEDGDDMMGVSYKEWKEGTDNATGSKQFFTIKTKSDKTFYIVVDESYNQQTAYLLTEASENDLLNFVNFDGNNVDSGETTVYTIPQSEKKMAETQTEVSDDNNTEKKTTKGSPVGIILIAVIGGAGLYYYKFKKKDNESEDEGDLEADGEDEELGKE